VPLGIMHEPAGGVALGWIGARKRGFLAVNNMWGGIWFFNF
jgi:hypothetical protein